MTSSQLQDLLIDALIRRAGGSKRQWRLAVGPVRIYDMATHATCNWSVSPSGSIQQNAHIERVLDDIRLRHPVVSAG